MARHSGIFNSKSLDVYIIFSFSYNCIKVQNLPSEALMKDFYFLRYYVGIGVERLNEPKLNARQQHNINNR